MAIRLADYYKRHLKKVAFACVSMLLAINFVLFILFRQLGVPLLDVLLLILMPVVLLQIFSLIVILRYALEPLNVLTRAITHVSGQPNDVTPPQINEPRFERTGLKPMVQVVYERRVAAVDANDKTPSPSLTDALPCGVVALNAKNEIIYANKAAPVVTDSQNRQSLQLLFPSDKSLETWLQTAATQKVNDLQSWERIANKLPEEPGRKIYDVIANYEKNAPSGIETIIMTFDKTDRYSEDEEALDFVSVAAHELRGPITVIRGYLDVLHNEIDTLLDPEQIELMKRLDVSAARLSSYVNNILNVAKYDRHHLILHLKEERFQDIYASIADDLHLRAQTQKRLLSVMIPDDLPSIAADRASLSEALVNLVDNAIKYSAEGGTVTITAAVNGNFVTCSVIDKGIGIPSSVIQNLFSKFYRSHRSRATVAGTGLGLFISKAIVESHGGTIGVRSKEGEGSTFSFSVPIYSTVADKLLAGDNTNGDIITSSSGWIRNHSKIGS